MAQLDRQGILLLIAAGADGDYPFDPIRAMKGCFIVSQIGKPEWRELFDFRPYDYGPFDSSIYRAKDALVGKSYLSSSRHGRYESYTVTEEGKARAAELRNALTQKERRWLRSVGHWVTSKSFNDLLTEIYGRFPEYAERSIARI